MMMKTMRSHSDDHIHLTACLESDGISVGFTVPDFVDPQSVMEDENLKIGLGFSSATTMLLLTTVLMGNKSACDLLISILNEIKPYLLDLPRDLDAEDDAMTIKDAFLQYLQGKGLMGNLVKNSEQPDGEPEQPDDLTNEDCEIPEEFDAMLRKLFGVDDKGDTNG